MRMFIAQVVVLGGITAAVFGYALGNRALLVGGVVLAAVGGLFCLIAGRDARRRVLRRIPREP
jgi:hypothetical protein